MSDCVLHVGGTRKGYGYHLIDGKLVAAHRLAYETERGPIPDGYHCHHLCEVPLCINVDHLVAITPALHNWITHEGSRYNLVEVCPKCGSTEREPQANPRWTRCTPCRREYDRELHRRHAARKKEAVHGR